VLGMVLVRHPAGSKTFSVPQYNPVMSGRRHKIRSRMAYTFELSSRGEMVPEAER